MIIIEGDDGLRVKTQEQAIHEAKALFARLAPPDVLLSEELIRDRREQANMSNVILDASALMAFLRGEPGGDRVQKVLANASISTVNLSEILAKASECPRDLSRQGRP